MEGKNATTTEDGLLLLLLNFTTSTVETQDDGDFFRRLPDENLHYTTTGAIVTALLLGSIIVGTVIGNTLVCVAVLLVRKLRRPCNYLLVSLAVSDLCVALLVMPMALIYQISGNWNFGAIMCDVWVSFDVLCCTASILNLCMISIDRYCAITRPLKYGVKRTPRRMGIYVGFVWLSAICISLPPLLLLGNDYTYSESGSARCIVCQDFVYQIYATIGSFYVPLVIMILVYSRIFCAARKIVLEERRAQSHLEFHCYRDPESGDQNPIPAATYRHQLNFEAQGNQGSPPAKQHRSSSASTTSSGNAVRCFAGGQRKSNESQCPMLHRLEKPSAVAMTLPLTTNSAQQQQQQQTTVVRNHLNSTGSITNSPHQKKLRFHLTKERKASTTLGIIMSTFIVCWLPFFVLALVRLTLKSPDAIPSSLSSFFLWLGYCNSLLNPIIYAIFNKDFRTPFIEILYCRCSNLNHMMREEFYQSQYGDPVNNYEIQAAETESAERLNHQGIELIDVEANTPSESFL